MTTDHRLDIRTPLDPELHLPRELAHPNPQYWLQQKYEELGGSAALGSATSIDGDVWTFGNGTCICFNPNVYLAFELHGDIGAKWLSLGGKSFGLPSTDELPTPDGIGRYNHFSNGRSIYWTPDTGALSIGGEIRKKWAALGWERSPLGYPVTDELTTPDGVGRYNHFSRAGSIYWTPGTGAQAVYGAIWELWAARGWERSSLGYPVSDEVDFADGGRANEFQGGGIYWWPDTGAIDLADVVVHYTGLFCFGETNELTGDDEPYVIISVSTPKTADTVRSQVYGGVDGGESRPDLIELYRGRPYGINIGTVLMEHDEGDPDKYKDEVHKIVMGVHEAGTLALGLIPIVGPFVAAIAGPALGTLMPSISGMINDLLGTADDRLDGSQLTLSAKQMVLLAARTGNTEFHQIGYKVETELMSGQTSSYKAYFGIVPA